MMDSCEQAHVKLQVQISTQLQQYGIRKIEVLLVVTTLI